MSDKGPRPEVSPSIQRPYRVAPQVQESLSRRQTRYWRRMQRRCASPRRYWVRSQRAYCRNFIRSELVAHRTMFHVSHKSVQPGEGQGERE